MRMCVRACVNGGLREEGPLSYKQKLCESRLIYLLPVKCSLCLFPSDTPVDDVCVCVCVCVCSDNNTGGSMLM